MAEYFNKCIDIKGKYLRKPIEQTTKVTKIKVSVYCITCIISSYNHIKYV